MTALKNLDGNFDLLVRDEDGIALKDSVTKARLIVMSCSAYRSMCDALIEQFQSGAGVILYRMGEGYGRKLMEAISRLGMKPGEILFGLEKLAHLAGWGKISIRIIDEKNIECVIEKSAFLLQRSDVGPTSCYFLSGLLATTASKLFDKKFKSLETKCGTSGSPLCKFKVFAEE